MEADGRQTAATDLRTASQVDCVFPVKRQLHRWPTSSDQKPRPVQAVLVASEELPENAQKIRGHDFNQGRDLDSLMESMLYTGLQATALGQAIEEVNRMVGAGGRRWLAGALASSAWAPL